MVRLMAAAVRPRPGPARNRAPADKPGDRGAIIVGWFTKIVISLALLGTSLFDAVSIAESRAHVNDAAAAAGDAALARYAQTQSLTDADAAARQAAGAIGATLAPGGITIVTNGPVTTLTVTVDIVASTVLVGHLPDSTKLTESTATVTRQVRL